jgi:hypothetical protein
MPPAFVTRLNQASTSLRRAFDPDHRRQHVRSRRLGNYSESSRRGIFFRAAALGDAGPARVPVRRRALKPTAAASGVNRRRRACPRAVVALGPWAPSYCLEIRNSVFIEGMIVFLHASSDLDTTFSSRRSCASPSRRNPVPKLFTAIVPPSLKAASET